MLGHAIAQRCHFFSSEVESLNSTEVTPYSQFSALDSAVVSTFSKVETLDSAEVYIVALGSARDIEKRVCAIHTT